MKRYLVAGSLFIVVLAAVIYAANSFLPGKIKTAAEEFACRELNSEITIGRVRLNVFKGILLDEVILSQADEEIPFMTIGQARILPSLKDLFSQMRLTFRIYLDDVDLSLLRDKEGRWHFPAAKPLAVHYASFLDSVRVNNLSLDFEDQKKGFKKVLAGVSCLVDFSLLCKVYAAFDWGKAVSGRADYDLLNSYFSVDLSLENIDLSDYGFPIKNFALKEGSIASARLHIDGKREYSLSGRAQINNCYIIKDGIEFRGDLKLVPHAVYSQGSFFYYINGNVDKGQIRNAPYVDVISLRQARFRLDEEALYLSDIEAVIEDQLVSAEGILQHTPELEITAYINTICDLKDFLAVCGRITPFTFDYKGKGFIDFELEVNAQPRKNKFNYFGKYSIEDASFQNLVDISAQGTVAVDELVVEEGQARYRNVPLGFEGSLKNFESPKIDARFKGGSLSAEASLACSKDSIDIAAFKLRGESTEISSKGAIDRKKSLYLNLKGSGTAGLVDARKALGLFFTEHVFLDKLNPCGALSVEFTINGSLDPKTWKIELAGQGGPVKVFNLEADVLRLNFFKDEKSFILSPLVLQLGRGKADFRWQAELLDDKSVFNLTVNDLELSLLKEQFDLKQEKLAGKLSLEGSVKSNGVFKLKDSQGSGRVVIKDGFIWQISFLEGLGEFLFIPEFDDIKFEECYSDMHLKDGNIIFENLALHSWKMDLNGGGKISSDRKVHFIFFPEFNPKLVAASEGLRKITTKFLGDAGLVIEVQGAFDKPDYSMKPVFISSQKKIRDFFKDLRQ
ncbi:MAG: hypothetical protein JW734_07245 [Candidatus Omnitrophica bacterium]|nr:hypothetical protein [Candidatus Omnitrophota bacterium]